MKRSPKKTSWGEVLRVRLRINCSLLFHRDRLWITLSGVSEGRPSRDHLAHLLQGYRTHQHSAPQQQQQQQQQHHHHHNYFVKLEEPGVGDWEILFAIIWTILCKLDYCEKVGWNYPRAQTKDCHRREHKPSLTNWRLGAQQVTDTNNTRVQNASWAPHVGGLQYCRTDCSHNNMQWSLFLYCESFTKSSRSFSPKIFINVNIFIFVSLNLNQC